MELDPGQQKIITAVNAAAGRIFDVSHQIHDRPELGYQEVFASNLLAETLESFDFQVERGFAGIETAFCGRKGKGRPRVAFLAEYDALPAIGHGCGHNIIATSALSAGIGLGTVVDELPEGEVWVVGTPAEETDGGKVVMVNRGAFNELDAALMIHPHEGNYMLTESLAMDAIQVEYRGRPSHAAAAPWEGQNALDAMLILFNSINALRQQLRPDARVHGIITYGGAAPNVIPEYTAARFYIRAKKRAYLNEVVQKFHACVQAAALATGTTCETSNYENSFDDMSNNLPLAQRMTGYMTGALGSKPFLRAPDNFGSIDMGNVSHAVPGIHILVDIADGKHLTPHTREFCSAAASEYAGQTMLRAGKALALTGYDFLRDAGFRAEARAEFECSLKPA